MTHLRTYDQTPPGLFSYVETLKGKRYRFGPSPHIESLARSLAQFRAGNGLPRPSVLEALQDIDCAVCAGLPADQRKAFCVESPEATVALNASSPIVEPCKGCGAPV